MYMTGFADEASVSLDGQIKATKELGWSNIEARNIDGVNIHDLDDAAFDVAYGKLQDAGIHVNCFGSTIANWGKHIDKPVDEDMAAVKRAIPRMKRIGTKLVRIMSYAVMPDRSAEDQMKEERFERLRVFTNMFLEAGIQPVHENCNNYGGMGWSYTLALIDNVPGLKLVYDTGNPVGSDDRTFPEPYPKQSSWKFYEAVKQHVVYIHIKDGTWNGTKLDYTYPGLGDGDVRKVMEDLIKSGYDGGISIEPHLGAVYHDESVKTDDDRKYAMYVEYGHRMEAMIKEIRDSIQNV
ncbi:MAG: TIM barrel protein [Lentisphaerae bacterium]|jgi:sugar phosphate isomerase/epimerase|nr:TIM barrel protein [Lentisphaerota bacterium]